MHEYGVNIEKLKDFIRKVAPQKTEYGFFYSIAGCSEYELQRLDVEKGKSVRFKTPVGRDATGVVEQGSLQWQGQPVAMRETICFDAGSEHTLFASESSTLYIFLGDPAKLL